MPNLVGLSLSEGATATFTDPAGLVERLADELRASELRYRRLFDGAKDGILLLDAQTGQVLDVNPFLEGLLGYWHDELAGKELWELCPVEEAPDCQAAVARLQAEVSPLFENLTLETKAKKCLQVEIVGTACLVAGVRVIHCTVRDITSRKRVEESVVRLIDDLLALVVDLRRREVEPARPSRA